MGAEQKRSVSECPKEDFQLYPIVIELKLSYIQTKKILRLVWQILKVNKICELFYSGTLTVHYFY